MPLSPNKNTMSRYVCMPDNVQIVLMQSLQSAQMGSRWISLFHSMYQSWWFKNTSMHDFQIALVSPHLGGIKTHMTNTHLGTAITNNQCYSKFKNLRSESQVAVVKMDWNLTQMCKLLPAPYYCSAYLIQIFSDYLQYMLLLGKFECHIYTVMLFHTITLSWMVRTSVSMFERIVIMMMICHIIINKISKTYKIT